MRGTREDLVVEAFKDKVVLKTVEAIVRTPKETTARDMAVSAFEYAFGKEATKLFKQNVGADLGDDIIFIVKMTAMGKDALTTTSPDGVRVKNMACNKDYFNFVIGTKENVYVIVDDFYMNLKQPILCIKVAYTGDEKIDERINKIIRTLRSKS